MDGLEEQVLGYASKRTSRIQQKYLLGFRLDGRDQYPPWGNKDHKFKASLGSTKEIRSSGFYLCHYWEATTRTTKPYFDPGTDCACLFYEGKNEQPRPAYWFSAPRIQEWAPGFLLAMLSKSSVCRLMLARGTADIRNCTSQAVFCFHMKGSNGYSISATLTSSFRSATRSFP